MPADSFESPLTLAACGGHVELAMLLLERGANIEEVNDEGRVCNPTPPRHHFRKPEPRKTGWVFWVQDPETPLQLCGGISPGKTHQLSIYSF